MSFPWPTLEQFMQIANAGPDGVDAGDLISKSDKGKLYHLGLVTPQYGKMFKLTPKGESVWFELHRMIKRVDPWKVADLKAQREG